MEWITTKDFNLIVVATYPLDYAPAVPLFSVGVGATVQYTFVDERREGRFLESARSSDSESYCRSDPSRLSALPALICGESYMSPALFGRVFDIGGHEYAVKFSFQKLAEGLTTGDLRESAYFAKFKKRGLTVFDRVHWVVENIEQGLPAVYLSLLADIKGKPRPSSELLDSGKPWPPKRYRRDKLNKTVSAMMPFSEEFDSVYRAIVDACKTAGVRGPVFGQDESKVVWRSDKSNRQGTVVKEIFERVSQSDVVICDLTGLNFNVAYELGLVDAVGSRVVLIADETEDNFDGEQRRRFDIGHRRIIRYSRRDNLEKFKDDLSEAIREEFKWIDP